MTHILRLASAFVIGLTIVGTGVSGPAGGRGSVSAQALNPCALLTIAEIQPLAGTASVAQGVSTAIQAVGSVTCRYTWGVGVGHFKLDVIVNDASRMFPGVSPDQIKQRLLESPRPETADAAIPDVGDGAVFKADSPVYVTATASAKGRILGVHLDGVNARDKKDDVIALLKSAVSRL